jgi:DNA-binding NtrC family response regulator
MDRSIALTRRLGKPLQGFTAPAMARLMAYDWPGNVRELSNVVERAGILAPGSVLELEEWPLAASDARGKIGSGVLRDERAEPKGDPRDERGIIEAALAESRGRVAGPSGAAAKLRVPPSTLEHKIRVLKINKSRFKFG